MGTYLEMWNKVRELDPQEVDNLIETLDPASGNKVDFSGMLVLDIDLLEALFYCRESVHGKKTLPKTVELDNLVRVHITGDKDLCNAFLHYCLDDPEGRKLLEYQVRGGSGGLGNHISFYDVEARPLLEKFFNEYEEKNV